MRCMDRIELRTDATLSRHAVGSESAARYAAARRQRGVDRSARGGVRGVQAVVIGILLKFLGHPNGAVTEPVEFHRRLAGRRVEGGWCTRVDRLLSVRGATNSGEN